MNVFLSLRSKRVYASLDFVPFCLFCNPEIVVRLKSQPYFRGRAEEAGQSQSCVRCNSALAIDDLTDASSVAHAHLGDLSIFAMADYEIQFAYEYPLFAVVGLLG
jgi:hypothetical protein